MPAITMFNRNFPTELTVMTLEVDDNGVPVIADGVFVVHADFYYIEQGTLYHQRDSGETEAIGPVEAPPLPPG